MTKLGITYVARGQTMMGLLDCSLMVLASLAVTWRFME